jgi:hypothetical protein
METLIVVPPCAHREARGLTADADDTAPAAVFARHESAVIGVFPNGEFRAGGAPCIEDLFVASLPCRQPLQKVEDEGFHYSVGHSVFFSRLPDCQPIDPVQRREFYGLQAAPRPAPPNYLRLEQANHRLSGPEQVRRVGLSWRRFVGQRKS